MRFVLYSQTIVAGVELAAAMQLMASQNTAPAAAIVMTWPGTSCGLLAW